MKLLTTFVLVGTIDSKDAFFATVEIDTNPQTMQVGHAVLPIHAFPCTVEEGDKFYILKLTEDSLPVIICENKESDEE